MNKVFARFETLMEKLNAYKPMDINNDASLHSYEIFEKMWSEIHVGSKNHFLDTIIIQLRI